MDGNADHMESVRHNPEYWRCDLTSLGAWIDADNINDLIRDAGFGGHIGLLSIDVDGIDYFVWQAIDVVDADIIICEYNGVFGDLHAITVPYRPDFQRGKAHYSNQYWGASIGAITALAERRGYRLIGSNRGGNNAFYLRENLYSLIADRIEDKRARPSLHRDSVDRDGRPTYLGGLERARAIAQMPVLRIDTGETVTLGSLGQLYSDDWLAAMGCAGGERKPKN